VLIIIYIDYYCRWGLVMGLLSWDLESFLYRALSSHAAYIQGTILGYSKFIKIKRERLWHLRVCVCRYVPSRSMNVLRLVGLLLPSKRHDCQNHSNYIRLVSHYLPWRTHHPPQLADVTIVNRSISYAKCKARKVMTCHITNIGG
jgi:hypothetical protein